MANQNVFKLLKQSDIIVGTKQVLKGIEEGTVRCVIVSSDADEFIINKVKAAAKAANVKILPIATMAELGAACGIEVGAATAGIKIDSPEVGENR